MRPHLRLLSTKLFEADYKSPFPNEIKELNLASIELLLVLIMLRLSHFIAALSLGAVFASNLFVSHYSGTVNTLTLTESLNGSYSLKLNTSLTTCGYQPSWLTYNSSIRTLYCTDEFGFGTATLISISAATNGSLTQLVKVTAMTGGVANGLYGNGYIAIAH